MDEKEAKARTLDKMKENYDKKVHGDQEAVVQGKLGSDQWWNEEGKGGPPAGSGKRKKEDEETVGKDGKRQKKLNFGAKTE